MFGFLNVYKPKGYTSHDVVAKLRRIIGIKQIGHTGTLDPFATGVLPVCIGKATKLIEYMQDDKEYLATIQFGKNTDTYDLEGKVTQVFDKKITKVDLESVLDDFRGEIKQYPPIYSAIKVNGKKLYEFARNGEDVEIKPRTVTIEKLELVDFNIEKQQAVLLVACSKGTYIRSIAYDIGKKLNCGGHLVALERTKAGYFTVANSIKLEELTDKTIVDKFLQNPSNIMKEYPKYELSDIELEKVSHGMSIKNTISNVTNIVFLTKSDRIYAIGLVKDKVIQVKKVFGL